MFLPRVSFIMVLIAVCCGFSMVYAHEINHLPKYGPAPKSAAQKAADAQFLARIDSLYRGNRKKAAEELSARGWQYLRQGNRSDAMKRFNQAWLLDSAHGNALWGMAAVQAGHGRLDDSLKLFAEAESAVGNNIDFSVDYARAIGIAGVRGKSSVQVNAALRRFARIHQSAPQHTLNLQNWAITLYYCGNFSEAWQKIKLAEATPRRADIDPDFVAALQSKMPRP